MKVGKKADRTLDCAEQMMSHTTLPSRKYGSLFKISCNRMPSPVSKVLKSSQVDEGRQLKLLQVSVLCHRYLARKLRSVGLEN